MLTVAIWLAFFSLLPVFYWVFCIIFDRLRFMLMPRHRVEIEFQDEEGVSRVEIVDVSSDNQFYLVAMDAIRAGRKVREAK
ncbi:hypothetical protein [Pantoea ananatis]|uniref:hypothetical protein n=1 Tax=Pantoea ananas TaxID=553 RepID=UPI000491394B|nr:hypothetical protein [Pantoea ananatis]